MTTTRRRGHRVRIRYPGWDYASPGLYAVTICIHRKCILLSTIAGDRAELSPAGLAVDRCIRRIPDRFPGSRILESIVMPDHVHLLLDLTDENGPSLSVIMRAFKAESARAVNLLSARRGRVWQPRFHDRIVRSWREAEKLAAYIRDNPRRWSAKRGR